eukprot:9466126-Pyramimonas_sp.AAC.1
MARGGSYLKFSYVLIDVLQDSPKKCRGGTKRPQGCPKTALARLHRFLGRAPSYPGYQERAK